MKNKDILHRIMESIMGGEYDANEELILDIYHLLFDEQ